MSQSAPNQDGSGRIMRGPRFGLILLSAALLPLVSCSANSGAVDGEDGGNGDKGRGAVEGAEVQVVFDVSAATGPNAAQVMRPSVTAYIIDDYDRAGILDTFLADFDQRVGMVLYDALDEELHNVAPAPNTATDLAARLQRVDQNIGKIVAAGGTALLNFTCPMPDFLSSRQGMTHSVLSGEREPSASPLSACSPPRNDVAARDAWVAVMNGVGAYFSKYGNQVVYMFGTEPENYFAGTAAEMFDTYGLAIHGIVEGHPSAKIAGVTVVGMDDRMSKAVAVYSPPPADRFTYTAEQLAQPISKLWVEYATANGLPIDYLTFHIWNPNAHPQANAYFEKYAETIEGWLTSAGYTGPPVTVLVTDFAGWENSCVVDPFDVSESYYDSEYLSAMFVDHAIAAQRYAQSASSGSRQVAGIHLVYGYLMDMQAWTPCMPVLAGLGGFPGMVSAQGLAKPSYNALWLMSQLQGRLSFPSSDDEFVNVVGAYDNRGTEQISVLLSRHLPSELHYVASGGGFPGYSFGSLFRHSHGFEPGPLSTETPSALMLSYLRQSDQPKNFVRDLLAEPAVFGLSDLGLSADRTSQLAAIQQQGRRLREEARTHRTVEVNIENLDATEYQLQTYAVDLRYGNPYRDRQSIQDQVDAVAGNRTALAQLITELKTTYSPSSTRVETRTITAVGNTATIEIEMEPHSVWLVVLSAI